MQTQQRLIYKSTYDLGRGLTSACTGRLVHDGSKLILLAACEAQAVMSLIQRSEIILCEFLEIMKYSV
jgi:hypothetical protein